MIILIQLFKSSERENLPTAKYKNKVKSMKSGLHLFSRMSIACQTKSGDMNTFLEHENHYWPLSLAENNLMRFDEKSDFLKCLETLTHILDPKNMTTNVETYSETMLIITITCLSHI